MLWLPPAPRLIRCSWAGVAAPDVADDDAAPDVDDDDAAHDDGVAPDADANDDDDDDEPRAGSCGPGCESKNVCCHIGMDPDPQCAAAAAMLPGAAGCDVADGGGGAGFDVDEDEVAEVADVGGCCEGCGPPPCPPFNTARMLAICCCTDFSTASV